MVLVLLAASCAPAKEEAAPAKEAAPAVKEVVPKKEVAPAVAEKAPAEEKEMVKVTLTKLDGTVVEKQMEKPKYGGRLTVSRNSVILAWDEAFQAPWALASTLSFTNETLLIGDWTRGPTGTGEVRWQFSDFFGTELIVGNVAEKWEMVNDVTLILSIRKGVRWHDKPPVNGREFTADDAVFSIKRVCFDIPTATLYSFLGVSRPTDVYATDKYTVVVKAPPGKIAETFEGVVGMVRMVPPEVVAKYGDHNKWENVTGTGAFILTDYVPMSSATWVRNPSYWEKDPFFPTNQLPYYDTLKMNIIPDAMTRLAALRTHKIDLDTFTYPAEHALTLIKTSPEIKYSNFYNGVCKPLGFRVDKPELPFKDIRVRKALIMGVDNREILDTYYQGDGFQLVYKVQPIPEYIEMGWYTPLEQLPPETREIYTYNPAKAKQLLAEAGYPNGFKTEVVINSGDEGSIDRGSLVKAYWEKIGVDLKLDVKESGVATSIYQRKTFKELLFWSRLGMPQSMYTVRTGNIYNWAMVDDPKAAQYYDDITAAYFDDTRRAKLVKEMNIYVLSQAWYYVPPSPNIYLFWMPWLKGYSGEMEPGPYAWWSHLKYLWVDQELKKAMGY